MGIKPRNAALNMPWGGNVYRKLFGFSLVVFVAFVTIILPGCTKQVVELNISAANSLTDAITEINALYISENPEVSILINLASSGTLLQQIENGAPCDVFLSAATTQMNALQNKGLILNETRRNFVTNSVVLIVPVNSTLGITSFNDLVTNQINKISIGDPGSVPAGTYAQQVFDLLNLFSAVQPKLVLASNVRQVLTYVETGDVDAGVVYSTDALSSSKVKVVATAPAEINNKIIYPAAIVKASKNVDAAQKYLNFLFGESARAIFAKYGFSAVSG
jgi:molybdate transport system substrate-binding protein